MPLCIYHILSCKQQQINVIKRKLIILGHRHFRLGPPSPWTSALAAGKDIRIQRKKLWILDRIIWHAFFLIGIHFIEIRSF